VNYAKERITGNKMDKVVAAVMPLEDLNLLRAIEDNKDLEKARKALAEPGETSPGNKWKKTRASM